MLRSWFVLFLLMLQPATVLAAAPLRIGMPEWCPYTCADKEKPGILVEMTRKALDAHGIKADFVIYDNWSRLLYDGKKGKVDAVLAVGKDEAPYLVFPEVPQVGYATAFFVRADDNWAYKGVKSFKGKVLLAFDNVDYGGEIQEYVTKYKADRTRIELATGETEEVVINKLAKERGDIYIEEENVGLFMIKSLGLTGKVKLAKRTDKPEQLFMGIGFSPKLIEAQKYARLVSDSTDTMHKDGTHKAIADRYIGAGN